MPAGKTEYVILVINHVLIDNKCEFTRVSHKRVPLHDDVGQAKHRSLKFEPLYTLHVFLMFHFILLLMGAKN